MHWAFREWQHSIALGGSIPLHPALFCGFPLIRLYSGAKNHCTGLLRQSTERHNNPLHQGECAKIWRADDIGSLCIGVI